MLTRTIERRSLPRFDFPSTIEYVLDASAVDDVRKAITIDISAAGMRAYMFCNYPPGKQLMIKAPNPIDCHKVTVCWTNKIQEDFYMVGLKCQA